MEGELDVIYIQSKSDVGRSDFRTDGTLSYLAGRMKTAESSTLDEQILVARCIRNSCLDVECSKVLCSLGVIPASSAICRRVVFGGIVMVPPPVPPADDGNGDFEMKKSQLVLAICQLVANFANGGEICCEHLWSSGEDWLRDFLAAAQAVSKKGQCLAAAIAAVFNSVRADTEGGANRMSRLCRSRALWSQLLFSTTTSAASAESGAFEDALQWTHLLMFLIIRRRHILAVFDVLKPRMRGVSVWETDVIVGSGEVGRGTEVGVGDEVQAEGVAQRLSHEQVLRKQRYNESAPSPESIVTSMLLSMHLSLRQVILLHAVLGVFEDAHCMREVWVHIRTEVCAKIEDLANSDTSSDDGGNGGEAGSFEVREALEILPAGDLLCSLATIVCNTSVTAAAGMSNDSLAPPSPPPGPGPHGEIGDEVRETQELLCVAAVPLVLRVLASGLAFLSPPEPHPSTSSSSFSSSSHLLCRVLRDTISAASTSSSGPLIRDRSINAGGGSRCGLVAWCASLLDIAKVDRESKAHRESKSPAHTSSHEHEDGVEGMVSVSDQKFVGQCKGGKGVGDVGPLGDVVKTVLQLLGNLVHGSGAAQDSLRESGALAGVLNHCGTNFDNPLAREWALFCVRNACEGSEANQAFISSLQMQGAHVVNRELKEKGLRVEVCTETGKVKFHHDGNSAGKSNSPDQR